MITRSIKVIKGQKLRKSRKGQISIFFKNRQIIPQNEGFDKRFSKKLVLGPKRSSQVNQSSLGPPITSIGARGSRDLVKQITSSEARGSRDIHQPITSSEARGSRDLGQPISSSEARDSRNLGQPIIPCEARGLRDLGQQITSAKREAQDILSNFLSHGMIDRPRTI